MCADRDDSLNLGIPMNIIWNIVMVFIIVIVWIMMPLSIFIYNASMERTKKSKVTRGIVFTIIVFVINTIIVVIIKFLIGVTNVDYNYTKINFNKAMKSEAILTTFGTAASQTQGFEMTLGWFNAIMIFFCLFGSIVWCCIGGYGMANAPIIMINSFLNKPTFRDAEDYTFTRLILRAENEEMIEEAKTVADVQKEYNKAATFNNRRKLVFELRRLKNKLREKFIKFEEVILIFKEEEN